MSSVKKDVDETADVIDNSTLQPSTSEAQSLEKPVGIEKEKKPRTPAQLEAVAKMLKARREKGSKQIEDRKKWDLKKEEEERKLREKLEKKLISKTLSLKARKQKRIMLELLNDSDSESEEEEVDIPETPSQKPTKARPSTPTPTPTLQSHSSEAEGLQRQKPKPTPKPKVPKSPKENPSYNIVII